MKTVHLNRQVSEDEEDGDCESVHNLKDTQCVDQLNMRCENVGKICKQKCAKGQEYKCKSNNLSRMECDVENGVCESTNRCSGLHSGTFRKSESSQDKCGKRN